MSRLAFISKVLYRLKRRYGNIVDIVWRESSTTNRDTGVKTIVKNSLRLQRVIVLPSQLHREFSYDLAYIAAAKNFTYGAFFDTDTRRFIVDARDLPVDFEIKPGYWLVYDEKRYDVKEAERFEESRGWLVLGKQSENVDPGNVIALSLFSEVSLTSEAEGQK